MATEYESLRLNVSLVDNVTPQLEKIRGSLTNLGGGQAGAGLEKLKRQTGELTEQIKGLATGFSGGSEAALTIAKSLGLATAGIAAAGLALVKGVQSLNEYTRAMQELGRFSTQTGFGAAQIKEMSEAMQRSGIDAGRAQTNIAGLAHAMADITRVNSEFRQRLLRNAGQGSDRAAMELLLGDLGRVANDPAAFVKKLQEAQQQIYDSMLARTGSATRAAEARKNFLADIGMPDLAEFRGEFATVTKAAEDMMARRIAQAREFQSVTTEIGQGWGRISETIQAALTPAATAILRPLAGLLGDVAGSIERGVESLRTMETPAWLTEIREETAALTQSIQTWGEQTLGIDIKGILQADLLEVAQQFGTRLATQISTSVQTFGEEFFGLDIGGILQADLMEAARNFGQAIIDFFKNIRPPEWLEKLGRAAGGALTATGEAIGGAATATSAAIGRLFGRGGGEAAPELPARQHGGPLGGGELALVGEAGPELFAPTTSGHILPNWMITGGGYQAEPESGGEGQGQGARLIAEQNRQLQDLNLVMEDLTAETSLLVDELQTLNQAIAPVGTRGGGGFGGPPGAGFGGAANDNARGGGLFAGGRSRAAYAGGGGYGGAGGGPGGQPRISGFAGGGATGSWGNSAYGGGAGPSGTGIPTGTGSDTGASPTATVGAAGDPNVPSALLETARTVAMTGGPQALDKFMRDNGYPRNGAWCGQFAAAVVKANGGTPPKNAGIASNWANWGEAVTGAPQPGDVAIRTDARGRVNVGQTGSHVTFVSGHDPATGRVTTIGGNQALSRAERSQGRTGESRDLASRYIYRRAPGAGGGDGGNMGAPQYAGALGGGGGEMAGQAGAGSGRAAVEAYFGKSINDKEYDSLMRATHAESGSRNSPEEQAMIMGTVLNRARQHPGGITGALTARNQFQAVTGTRFAPGPSAEYRRGPSETRRGSIEGAAQDLLHRVPTSQTSFTAASRAAYGAGTNVGYLAQLQRTGGAVYGGTQFGGRLAEPRTRVAALNRRELDQQMARETTQKVEGTGKLTVDVNAPAGTKVAAEGGGLFKQTQVNRQTQMARAAEGPAAEAA